MGRSCVPSVLRGRFPKLSVLSTPPCASPVPQDLFRPRQALLSATRALAATFRIPPARSVTCATNFPSPRSPALTSVCTVRRCSGAGLVALFAGSTVAALVWWPRTGDAPSALLGEPDRERTSALSAPQLHSLTPTERHVRPVRTTTRLNQAVIGVTCAAQATVSRSRLSATSAFALRACTRTWRLAPTAPLASAVCPVPLVPIGHQKEQRAAACAPPVRWKPPPSQGPRSARHVQPALRPMEQPARLPALPLVPRPHRRSHGSSSAVWWVSVRVRCT